MRFPKFAIGDDVMPIASKFGGCVGVVADNRGSAYAVRIPGVPMLVSFQEHELKKRINESN